MAKEEEKKKIEADSDYIYSPSCDFSLEKFLLKHSEGVNDDKAAQVLLTTPDKIREYYAKAIELIQKDLRLNREDND